MIARTHAFRDVPAPTLVGLLGLSVLAWAGLGVSMMTPLSMLMMPTHSHWGVATIGAVYGMWAVMMAAMMLPSAVPMVAALSKVAQARRSASNPAVAFVAGYLVVWAAFSAIATAAQWALQSAGMLSPMGSSMSRVLTGILLLAAGVYQFTPLKRVCLRQCRTPLGFLMTEWRDGTGGALTMGMRHGGFCLGCCWALMILLFAFGVMNLPWAAALAVIVAVEKVAPWGDILSRAIGGLLAASGAAVVLSALL